ncbi:MAG TPA: trypsin-like serine protease [Anaerolineales bacterium]
MKKVSIAIVLMLALTLSTAGIAGAVTDGTLDGDGHAYVVLLLMEVGGQPMYRCSGTLIAPRVLVTAGHCTSNYPDEPYSGMRIFTESDVQAGIGTTNNYPYGGGKYSIEAESWAAHPLYETGPFYLHDAGVVILSKPVKLETYGALPTVDQLDALKVNKGNNYFFTAVGYGLQESFPDAAYWKTHNTKTRYVANPWLIQINGGIVGDYSLLLSNNPNGGGTCFGDSGGANFLGDTNLLAGITSFGMNGNCAGTGGVFRTDRQNVLDFINQFVD